MDEPLFDDTPPRVVIGALPPVPSYPAPLPPSLAEVPVWEGPEPVSDSDDEDSMSESGDYETVHHEPLSKEKAMDSLKDMVRVWKSAAFSVSCFASLLTPLPYFHSRKPLLAKKEGQSMRTKQSYRQYHLP